LNYGKTGVSQKKPCRRMDGRKVELPNLKIDDAIIAATSIKMNAKLITYNFKDFKYIPERNLPRFLLYSINLN
jgi:predicted nucleic acid-binding protein